MGKPGLEINEIVKMSSTVPPRFFTGSGSFGMGELHHCDCFDLDIYIKRELCNL